MDKQNLIIFKHNSFYNVMKELEENLNFKIFENNNEINIFFDKKDLNLIGWQTEDIYQNLSITFISSVKKNQEIDSKIFKLPQNK